MVEMPRFEALAIGDESDVAGRLFCEAKYFFSSRWASSRSPSKSLFTSTMMCR
jgi:hypothetical protein